MKAEVSSAGFLVKEQLNIYSPTCIPQDHTTFGLIQNKIQFHFFFKIQGLKLTLASS